MQETQNQEAIIFDTTLREGMQTPGGIGGTLEERVYAANLISRFADFVELGMPANAVDYGIISAIKESFIENRRESGIAVLCRIRKDDIDKGEKVLERYHKTCAHLFVGTSEEHRDNRFRGEWTPEDYERNIENMLAYAAEKDFDYIMFSPEDSYRTFQESHKLFFMFVDAAIRGYERGNKGKRKTKLILNFPDTVGLSTLTEFDGMLDKIIERYGKSIEICLHGHDDNGTSTPQAQEEYIKGKARWLQTTFGKLGERNGIAQTEAVIAGLINRGYLKRKSYFESKDLVVPYAKAILAALGRIIPEEALVSGYRTNVSTAGIHTDIASKDNATYHINGTKFGATPVLEFGPTSGSEQIRPLLHELGFEFEKHDPTLDRFANELKQQCNDEKRSLTETDVMYQAVKIFGNVEDPMQNIGYRIVIETGFKPTVEMDGEYNGHKFHLTTDETEGSIEGIISGLDEVINSEGERTLSLVKFEPTVVPKIPAEYLTWTPGEFPRVPEGLDMHSDLRVITGIRNKSATNGHEVYYGYACEEDSAGTMFDSVIDAIVKMTTIEKYFAEKAKL